MSIQAPREPAAARRRSGPPGAGLAYRDAVRLWSRIGSAGRFRPARRGPGEFSITTEPSIDALIQRCAGGDVRAFRALYAAQAPRLNGLALRITREASLAADAVQDAFLQVWRRAERFDGRRGSGEAWLAGLVRYRAIDIVRSRSREHVGAEPPEAAGDDPDALQVLTANAEWAALRACLGQLPPDGRRLVAQAFVEGLSHSQLAERLDEPLGTIKGRIRRALIALRKCLEP